LTVRDKQFPFKRTMHLLIDMMNSEAEIRVGDAGRSAYDFLFHKSMSAFRFLHFIA